MNAGPTILAVIVMLLLLPFALLLDLLAARRKLADFAARRRAVPLQDRNRSRATFGAFGLVICAVLAVSGFPVVGWKVTAGIAVFALLYLGVGLHGSQGSRFDVMSALWWAVLALGCAALLGFLFIGFPL
jgi:hypothetical protein